MKKIAGILALLLFVGAVGTFVLGANYALGQSIQNKFVMLNYWQLSGILFGSGVIAVSVLAGE